MANSLPVNGNSVVKQLLKRDWKSFLESKTRRISPCFRFRAMVLEERGDSLLVGLADPTDIHVYDELHLPAFIEARLGQLQRP